VRSFVLLGTVLVYLGGCTGLRTSENTYTAHAENFNILFFQIPGGDTQKRALALVPQGGEIVTLTSSPKDLTSVLGFINRLIGVDITSVSGLITAHGSADKPQAR
jgi:hypothetical protein